MVLQRPKVALATSNLLSGVSRHRNLAFFIPSPLSPDYSKTTKVENQHGGISSLDGLRGLACLFVVNEHIIYNFSRVFLLGYSALGNYSVVQLPFIRLLWSGLSMVNVFFVISGYVLTYKPFLQIHKGDSASARATIASSTFRRVPRLYLPMWVSVWICGFMTWLGFYNRPIEIWQTKENMFHLHEGPPLHFDTFWKQFQDVWRQTWRPLNVFEMKDRLLHAEHYDLHTWTIPVEFRCSMVLFAIISAISQFKMRFRMLIMIFLIAVVTMMQQYNTVMFLTGAALSDFDHRVKSILQLAEHNLSRSTVSSFEQFVVRWLHPDRNTYTVLFVLGMYFLSIPTFYYPEDPFYAYVASKMPFTTFIPPQDSLRLCGAALVVWTVANSMKLKPIFVNPVSTYLGKISFALYLVHGNTIRVFLYSAIPTIYAITGDGTWENQTATQITFSAILGLLIVYPIAFYLSDLFMRAVDIPCTQLGRKVELWMTEDRLNGKPSSRT